MPRQTLRRSYPTTSTRSAFTVFPTLLSISFLTVLAGATAAQVPEAPAPSRPAKIVAPAGYDVGLPFSPALWSDDLLFLSGAIGNPPGKIQVDGDIEAQTRQTLKNLRSVLAAADLDLDRVVSMNIYLTDLREFPTFWRVLQDETKGHGAAGAAVEADLAIPGARLEMSMVAARPGVTVDAVQPQGWKVPEDGGRWAVRAGKTLFISGMASIDPKSGAFVGGDLKAQVDRAMSNVGTLLQTAGMGWGSLTRCRVFLPDPADYGAMNDAYGAFLTDAPPARATVRARLLHPEARFGVQCIAVLGDDHRVVKAPGTAPSNRPFSPAVEAGGRLYLAGMVGRGEAGFPKDVAAQTRLTLERLQATLQAAGLSFDDVVDATVYLADSRYYGAMNEVYRDMVGADPPARATVGMQLMSPDAWVEIQMTADSR